MSASLSLYRVYSGKSGPWSPRLFPEYLDKQYYMSVSRVVQIGCKIRSFVGKADGAKNLQKQTGKDSLTVTVLGGPGPLRIEFAVAVCKRIGSNQGAAAMPNLSAAVSGFRKLPPTLIFLNVVSAWRRNHFFGLHPGPLPRSPAPRRQGLMPLTDTGRYGN